jgi:cephalosporin-C deacetylase
MNAHGYPFDPSHGMDLARLLAVVPPPAPPDFAAFWQARHAAALRVAAAPRVLACEGRLGRHAVFGLRYGSTGGVTIGGWLLLPLDGRVRRGLVSGHGYGGRAGPEAPPLPGGTVLLQPCFRGFGRSPVAGISGDPALHVVHDIRDRDRYVIGGCVDDLWLAVSVLLALWPQLEGRIAYAGTSFGGGVGALAAPWDARIARLFLEVPTFGHQALRLELPCTGSGQAVQAFHRAHGFNVLETLAYYDAASAARHLRIPALVAAALFDPAVAPPGQFAVFNALPQGLRRLFVLDAGHHDHPGRQAQANELARELEGFLGDL